MRSHYPIWLSALLLLACSCDEGKEQGTSAGTAESGGGGASSGEPDEAQDAPEPGREATRKLMANHYEKAWEARDAVIRGDFDEAKKAVKWLAEHEQGDALPEDVRPELAPMQKAARRFVDAEELREAGAAFAEMLDRCGSCHAQVEGGPEFDPPPVPEGDAVADHMQRHRWAADRMWEGLVGASPELYHRGAEALAETELKPEELPGAAKDPEKADALAKHVHELATTVAQAEGKETTVEAYGRFIASCAGCHRHIGGGPGADNTSEPTLVNDLLEP